MDSTSIRNQNNIQVEYLILVRHGAREMPYNLRRENHRLENAEGNKGITEKNGKKFAKREIKGRPKSLSLAGWLAEALSYYKNIKVAYIWSSPQKHGEETAGAYKEVLNDQDFLANECPIIPLSELNPEVFWDNTDVHKEIITKLNFTKNDQALLICGHQPQLTWLFNDLMKYRKSRLRCFVFRFFYRRKPLPLRQSEAAFLQLLPKPQILWAISELDKDLISEVKDKIKSKMDVAKFFAGFISLLLGITITSIKLLGITDKIEEVITSVDSIWLYLLYLGLLLILLSLGFCVGTLFAYDKLLMPTVFWSGKPKKFIEKPPKWTIKRPPCQVHWILHSNMVRIWRWMFTPAVLTFFLGLSALLTYALRLNWIFILIFIFSLLIVYFLYRHFSPKLGFDD